MNNQNLQRSFLVCRLWLVLMAVPCVVGGLVWRERHQERLNLALIAAIKHNNTNAVVAALYNGADPSAREKLEEESSFWQHLYDRLRGKQRPNLEGQTALYLAVSPANIEEVSRNCDWLPKDSALIHAILHAGANPNLTTNGVTPFMRASRFYEPDIMYTLLHSGANIDSKDAAGQTALWSAAALRRTDTALFLLKEQADPNTQDKDGATPLMVVAEYADVHPETAVRMARLLLLYRADPQRVDAQDRTVQDYVVDTEKAASFIRLLQQADAKQQH